MGGTHASARKAESRRKHRQTWKGRSSDRQSERKRRRAVTKALRLDETPIRYCVPNDNKLLFTMSKRMGEAPKNCRLEKLWLERHEWINCREKLQVTLVKSVGEEKGVQVGGWVRQRPGPSHV
jgi:hypothetical protein